MHISDKIKKELLETGWVYFEQADEYRKLIEGYALAGQLSSGSRVVCLNMDDTGRWFSRLDGWGKVEKDIDLRNYSDASEAIAAVLKDR